MDSFSKEKEVCKILGVSRTTLSSLRKQGAPFMRIGNGIRYSMVELVEWFKKQNTKEKSRRCDEKE